ncbi:kinesin-like protein KIN-4C isoform X2 [Vicia villosa]|uniref:kinesin-like protein KIN-4C isoform X2 n=1 Tax=Vicia villosa TaxID=3911 RepID=UPI00273BE65E|nr:kinesin-like protein KIN-4C isoform X2 [Vicia villosa]
MKKTTRRSKQTSPVVIAASDANEKQHYEERIRELERENKAYQIENAELKERKGNDSSSGSNGGVEKLKKDYLQKLNLLEDQVSELKKKLGSQSQFSTHRKRADESTRQLQYEIQSLKAHKAKLQCTIKLESVRFRLSKALLEKEVLQLKKEGRRNDIKAQSLQTSNDMLKMVLQRKTEEASAAIKRLRDMIAARKAVSNRSSGGKIKSCQVIQDAEHELEVTTQLHKLCSQYESKIEKMTGEIAQLKEELEMQRQENSRSELQEEDLGSPEKDYDDIQDLKEQVNNLSSLLKELQLRKEKHEPRDKSQDLAHALSEASYATAKMDTPEMSSSNENSVKRGRAVEGLCCSCSRKSLCKTTKCKCRSTGGSCGPSCGCSLSKCTNRELGTLPENESLKVENSECSTNKDGEAVIANECAKLLESALVQKPANQGPKKKPLCDIQNSMGNMDAQKKGRKKNVRKPVIHVVTKDPMSSSP